jgi:hypothetical protein
LLPQQLNIDHWCFWLGNAIAKRNYRYFWWFIVSALSLSMLLLVMSIGIIVHAVLDDNVSIGHAMARSVSSVALGVYSFMMCLSLFGLCGFHSFAISRNITTNEYIKNVYTVVNPNPYDKGCFRNVRAILFSPVPRSRVAVCTHHTPLLPVDSRSSTSSLRQPVPLSDDELALLIQGNTAIGGTDRGQDGGFHVLDMRSAGQSSTPRGGTRTSGSSNSATTLRSASTARVEQSRGAGMDEQEQTERGDEEQNNQSSSSSSQANDGAAVHEDAGDVISL